MTREKYQAAQKAFVEMTGLKKGSKVIIMRKAEDHEYGWLDTVHSDMLSSGESIVKNIGTNGILLDDHWWYPFTVLQPLVKPLPKPIELDSGDYSVEFNADGGISIGCQYVSHETIKKIYETSKEVLEG